MLQLETLEPSEKIRARIKRNLHGAIMAGVGLRQAPNERFCYYHMYAPEVAAAVQALLSGNIKMTDVTLLDGTHRYFLHELETVHFDPFNLLSPSIARDYADCGDGRPIEELVPDLDFEIAHTIGASLLESVRAAA